MVKLHESIFDIKTIHMKNSFPFQEYQENPQKFTWDQLKEANKWKKSGFAIEVPLQQEELDYQSLKLQSNSHFYQKFEGNDFKLKEAQAEIDDIRERYEHFVCCEKITLSDRIFAHITKRLARLNSHKSRANEIKKYMTKSK